MSSQRQSNGSEFTDKRLRRGARSRRVILDRAVDIASLKGLDAVSFSRVAADAGVSKSGVQTLFGTKEAFQLATIARARELFLDAVVEPALLIPPGAERLRALTDRWIAYAETPIFAGGCFFVATLAEFDSRPGAIRDALQANRRDWIARIAAELEEAEIDVDAELTAFMIDAVLSAANISLRLGDADAVGNVRRIVDGLLAGSARTSLGLGHEAGADA